jgi:3-isopropylmalate/(R)-2-methylmalate dehydratase small subunit
LNGLDDIGITMQHEDAIAAYEEQREPWMPVVDHPEARAHV